MVPEGGARAPHVIYLSVVLKVVMRCSNMEVTSDLDKSESSSQCGVKGAGSGGVENCVVNLLKAKEGEEDAAESVCVGRDWD